MSSSTWTGCSREYDPVAGIRRPRAGAASVVPALSLTLGVVDLRRELDLINRRGYDYYQDKLGEIVVWFEYDAKDSAYDHVYDEPSPLAPRAWRPALLVPVLWVNEDEGSAQNSPEGRLVTHTLTFAVTARALDQVGLSDPRDQRRHLDDLILWRRTFWRVSSYKIHRARTAMLMRVECTQVGADDDMPFDVLPTLAGLGTTVRPFGFPSEGYADQVFPNHELPANHTPYP